MFMILKSWFAIKFLIRVNQTIPWLDEISVTFAHLLVDLKKVFGKLILKFPIATIDSRYLEVKGTLWNTSRYPYFDISDFQNWGKYKLYNQILQMNM